MTCDDLNDQFSVKLYLLCIPRSILKLYVCYALYTSYVHYDVQIIPGLARAMEKDNEFKCNFLIIYRYLNLEKKN